MLHSSTNQRGFTLVELLTSIAVFAILLMVGVPGYISFVRNGQLTSINSTLFSDLMYARSEAIKRKVNIVMCRSSNPTASTPACGGGTSADWSTGWIVFADVGGTSGVYDAGTDILLHVSNLTMSSVKIHSNATAATRITYGSDGALDSLSVPSVFAICDDRDGNGTLDTGYGRQLNITAVGRPEVTNTVTSCTSPS